MKKKHLISLLVILLLVVACSGTKPLSGKAVETQAQQGNQNQQTRPINSTNQNQGLPQAAAQPPTPQVIQITSQGFSPPQFRIRAGETVTWQNVHTTPLRLIGGTTCPFLNSPFIAPQETFAWRFTSAVQCPVSIGFGLSNEACTNNAQCSRGRVCVDQECHFISEKYDTNLQCAVKCNIIRVKLITYHNHFAQGRVEQNYTLGIGKGSYTGAGALAWKILPIPDYCNIDTTQVNVPFEITYYNTTTTTTKEVILLHPGQEKTLTHPTLDLYGFTLKVNQVDHTCGASTYQG